MWMPYHPFVLLLHIFLIIFNFLSLIKTIRAIHKHKVQSNRWQKQFNCQGNSKPSFQPTKRILASQGSKYQNKKIGHILCKFNLPMGLKMNKTYRNPIHKACQTQQIILYDYMGDIHEVFFPQIHTRPNNGNWHQHIQTSAKNIHELTGLINKSSLKCLYWDRFLANSEGQRERSAGR